MYGCTQYDILVQLCTETLLQICYLQILFYSMLCCICVFIFYMGIFKPVIYADDTSILLTANNEAELKNKMNHVLDYMTVVFGEWISSEYGKNKYNEIYF